MSLFTHIAGTSNDGNGGPMMVGINSSKENVS